MQEAVKKANTPGKNALTGDGVHMQFPGDMMMATGVLNAIGLDKSELAKAQDSWLDIPGTSNIKVEVALSQREMQQLEKGAATRNTTPQNYANEEFKKALDSLKK